MVSSRPGSVRSVSTNASSANFSAASRRRSATGSSSSSKRSRDESLPGIRSKRLRFESNGSTTSTSDSRPSSSSTIVPSSPRRQPIPRPASSLSTSTSATTSTRTVTGTTTTTSYPARTATSQGQTTTTRTRTRPRTATTYLTAGGSEQAIICAVTESRGVSPTVGLACMNLSTMQATLCQIVDSQMYVRTLQKLYTWSPSMVLFPSTLAESKMLMFLNAEMPQNVELRNIDKRYFNENDGSGHLQQMALGDEIEPLKVAVEGKFYALCAFSGVLEYLKRDGEYDFAPNSLRISFEPSDGSMMIDLSTIHSLELIQNLHNAKSKDSLFGLLNETLTPMGSRLLRSWVLQPSVQREVLGKRYDSVEELTSHENIFVGVRNALKSFVDVDKVLTNVVILPNPKKLAAWQEECINYVLILKDFVQKIMPIYEALSRSESELLRQIASVCAPENYAAVVELISASINSDTCYSRKPLELRNQKLYAVKAGTFGLLDVARTAHKETVEDVLAHCSELATTSELSLEVSFENSRGYFLKFPTNELEGRTLDSQIFINVFKKKKNIECQTMELLKLNGKLKNSFEEIMLMSISAVTKLITDIRAEIGPLFKISDSIAMLDVLSALAEVASKHDYVKPAIASTTAVKAARHPIKIKKTKTNFVANDIYAPSNARLQVITGCNMSGKSTYIRAVALLQVMAQVGSFVPAEHAEFSIRNQLFARVSTDDNISANVSTFAAEMREAAFILNHVNESSMVIVDELGRGTSTADGLAIATAIAEALLSSGAVVWFVTHFHDLAKFLDKQPGVWNLHLSVDQQRRENQMLMLYQIAEGPVQDISYGIRLAKVTCMPPHIMQRAEQVAEIIRRQRAQFSDHSYAAIEAKKQKVLLGLRDQLSWAKESTMSGNSLHDWMKALQDEFVIRMGALQEAEERLDRSESTVASTVDESMLDETEMASEERRSSNHEQSTSNHATGPTKSKESETDLASGDRRSSNNDQSTSNQATGPTRSKDSEKFSTGNNTSEVYRRQQGSDALTRVTVTPVRPHGQMPLRPRSSPAEREQHEDRQSSETGSSSSFFGPVQQRTPRRGTFPRSSPPGESPPDPRHSSSNSKPNSGVFGQEASSSSPNLGLYDPISSTLASESERSSSTRLKKTPRVLPPVPLFNASASPSEARSRYKQAHMPTAGKKDEDEAGSSFENLLDIEEPVEKSTLPKLKNRAHKSGDSTGLATHTSVMERLLASNTASQDPARGTIASSQRARIRIPSYGLQPTISSSSKLFVTPKKTGGTESANDSDHGEEMYEDELHGNGHEDPSEIFLEPDADMSGLDDDDGPTSNDGGPQGLPSAPGSDNNGNRAIARSDADRRYEGVTAKASRSSSIWKIPSSSSR